MVLETCLILSAILNIQGIYTPGYLFCPIENAICDTYFLIKKTVIKGLDSSSIEYLCKVYDGKYCYDVKNKYHGTNKKIIGCFDD